MRSLNHLLTTVAVIGVFAVHLAAIVVHVVTVWFAYQLGGMLSAVATFLTPLFAEFYWAFDTWMRYGISLNLFTQMCLAIVGVYLFNMIVAMLAAALEDHVRG